MRNISSNFNAKGKQIKTWKNKEGNFCFSYDIRQPLEKPWVIIVVAILFLSLVLIEYLMFSTFISFFPLLICFMIILPYWAFYPCKNNEIIEELMMNKNVDLRLHNYLRRYQEDVFEIKRKYYQESKGTYGVVIGTYMLILLSNNEVLEFELKFHPATETTIAYNEFLREPHLCTNVGRKKIIESRSLARFWKKLDISESTKLSSVIVIIILLGCIPLSLFIWIISAYQDKAVYYFLGFVVASMLLRRLIGKSTNNILKLIDTIISIPIGIIHLSFKLMMPVMTVFMSYMFLGVFSIMPPIFLIRLVNFVFDLNISKSTTLFISLVFASIVSVYGSKLLHWIIKEYSPLKDWGNHKFETVKIELALYVISKKNVTFLIYFAYLVFLFLSGFMQIQYNEPLIKENIDSAVLKSFIVFIAFSNMVAKSKETEIEAKPLLTKMLQLITIRDRD